MKIMIIGSMKFAQEMVNAKQELEVMRHTVSVPCDIEHHIENPDFIDDLAADEKHCIEEQVMRRCFDLVAESDAVLVLNLPKNGVDGYIGTSTLMELAIAYHLRKKLFILYKTPHYRDARWAQEVAIFEPTILNGDLQKILQPEQS